MLRLNKINYHISYKDLWRTNIVLYPDNELCKFLNTNVKEVESARDYLIGHNLIRHFQFKHKRYFYLMFPPTTANKNIKKISSKGYSRDKRFLFVMNNQEDPIANTLLYWRFKFKLSQSKAAKIIGVSRNTYRGWEYGMKPRSKNLLKIKRIFNKYKINQLEKI